MAIVFSDREGDPFRDLHNDPWSSFDEDGAHWPTAAIFVLAARHDDPAVGERLRKLWKSPEAREAERELAASRSPGWEEREPDVIRQAVARKFEANLARRALLLSTGEDALVCEDDPSLGPLLMEVRRVARARADDVRAVQCEHRDAADLARVCVHGIDRWPGPVMGRRFIGRGVEYGRACDPCARLHDPGTAPWRWVCAACAAGIPVGSVGDVGEPEYATRDDGISLVFERVTFAPPTALRTIEPAAADRWIALDVAGRLLELDAATATVTVHFTLPDGTVAPPPDGGPRNTEPIDLHLAPDGSLVAVVERYGTRGAVVDLARGAVVMTLTRGDYCVEHCTWPVGWVRRGDRLLLVHGTDWNRLDLSDPRTGELLTAREPPGFDAQPRSARALDYFWCRLHVAPDGELAWSDGWVWHPVPVPRVFSLARWADGNVWETEDGPSLRSLDVHDDAWDLPACWIDARTVARWSVADPAVHPSLPGVDVFDVATGERLRSLIGPRPGDLAFDERLYAFGPHQGVTAWDVRTGERTFAAPDFCPDGYHARSRCFWRLEPDGAMTLARVVRAIS